MSFVQISDLIVSITTTTFSTTTIVFVLIIVFFASSSKTTSDLMIDSKHDSARVDLNEIDFKKINFEFFEIDIEFEFAMRKTFSSFDLIEFELKLKLIVNSSNLHFLKNLLNMTLKRDLKLTATSFVFR